MDNQSPVTRSGMPLRVIIVCALSLHIAKPDQLTRDGYRLVAPWLGSCMELCSNGSATMSISLSDRFLRFGKTRPLASLPGPMFEPSSKSMIPTVRLGSPRLRVRKFSTKLPKRVYTGKWTSTIPAGMFCTTG